MNKVEYVISAAGGNETVIRLLDHSRLSSWYAKEGAEMIANHGAEQAGFLLTDSFHLEMSGGEFCGNATRAAAVLLSIVTGKPDSEYTVSGFSGQVTATTKRLSDQKYWAESIFPGMEVTLQPVVFANGQNALLVDLGGIVHVLIEGDLPENYRELHREITDELSLRDRSAVGVVWYQKRANSVRIDPIVWVKEIDSFFYETSCGSGSIAAACATGFVEIEQVTGKSITVKIGDNNVSLSSEMEVV